MQRGIMPDVNLDAGRSESLPRRATGRVSRDVAILMARGAERELAAGFSKA